MVAQERRNDARIRAYRSVRLHKPGLPKVVETLTKDLSSGGLRCLSPLIVPVSSELNVELILSDGEAPLTVTGRTRWVRIIPESDQFDLGISFQSLTPETKRRLSAYLERIALITNHVPA